MRALLPNNERDRLAALYRYGVLDTPPESCFDRLTRIAARIFGVPVSLITFVDSGRQFFKSQHGIDLQEFSLDCSLCGHAILNDEVTAVRDAREDLRFADNPLVVHTPCFRFYVAAPLKTADGFRLGTISVLDVQPRPLPDENLMALLKDLADEVMDQLEAKREKRRFAAESRKLEVSHENIQKAQQRAMQALEAGHMGYWDRDAKTDLITFSPVLEEMLGLDHDRYDGSVAAWLEHVHPEDREMIVDKIQVARRNGKNYTFKYRPLTKDGSERWISTTGTYRMDAAGCFAGAYGVSWDSTASEVAARKLKMSEELFRVLSDSAPIGIFRTDLNSNLTYVNSTLAAYNGVSEAELLGKGWVERIHPDDRDELLKSFREESGDSREYEHRLVLPNGSVRWVCARTTVVLDQNGTVMGKVGTVDDITQQRQMLQDLRQSKETAEVANCAKDVFLANVSHELRTPLNGVLGMSELLVDAGLNADQLEMAEIVRDSAHGLLLVVNDMLDLSRIEAGCLAIDCQPFSLRTIIQQTHSLFKAEAKQKGVSLLLDYAANLPESYLGDSGRIRQILTNYLSNAIKFSSSGEITIEARRELKSGEFGDAVAQILLSVHDSGLGIEPEAQKKLFQPFSQVDSSSTRRNGGAGLGLAICKRLAELMNGSVGVKSTLGHGSTFWVRLPLAYDKRAVNGVAYIPVTGGSLTSDPVTERPDEAAANRLLSVEDSAVNQKVAMGSVRIG